MGAGELTFKTSKNVFLNINFNKYFLNIELIP